VEITSRYNGTITKIHYPEGEIAAVGTALIDIDVEGAVAPAAKDDTPAKTEPVAPAAPPTPTPTPTPAPPPPATPVPQAPPARKAASSSESKAGTILTTPAVRRLARDHDIDLVGVYGTGKDGRILKGDVLNYIKSGPAEVDGGADDAAGFPLEMLGGADAGAGAGAGADAAAAGAAAAAAGPRKTLTALQEDKTEPIRGMQRLMVKSMKAALKVPHFGYNDEVEMDAVVTLRQQLKSAGEQRGVKITYMPIFLKAASLALAQFPVINSQVSADEETLTYKASHNIGVAMDTPAGLLVPNIKNCEQLSIIEIAEEMNRLQVLGAAGKLGAADLKDGEWGGAAGVGAGVVVWGGGLGWRGSWRTAREDSGKGCMY
jgi:2-oxoisovalerate dehydrogenase E2 component (dihydrolipoyl transacylase)